MTTHELDAPPWLRVDSTLMATARTIREIYDARFAPLNLNLTQASIIAYVHDFGPVTQTKIADHLSLGRASIGTTIDRLEERSLLERRPADDRRVWLVALTAGGTDICARIAAIDQVLREEMRSGISRSDRQALALLLTRLQRNLLTALDSSINSSINPSSINMEKQ